MHRLLAGGLLAYLVLLALVTQGGAAPATYGSSGRPLSALLEELEETPLPECIIDLDCGTNGYTGYFCSGEYIVRDLISYECIGGGRPHATCVNHTDREYVDWCGKDEVCVDGQTICQPKVVPKGGDEASRDCSIECVSERSCGLPHFSPRYCGDDGHVYQDYISYRCHNPGWCSAFCTREHVRNLVDYCGPKNRCRAGSCFDEDYDRSPQEALVNTYDCEAGEICMTDGRVYKTCRGSRCFLVKGVYSEVDVTPGRIRER